MALVDYLTARYSTIGDQLGYESADYALVVTDTLTLLDIDLESSESNVWKLQRIAEYLFWKKVVTDTSLDIDFTADSSSYKRSQMNEQARKNMMDAERDVYPYLPIADATVESISGTDPYGYYEARDNAGL